MSEAYARAALDRECDALVALTGGRNEALNASSFSLGQLVGAGLLDEVEVAQRLEVVSLQNGYAEKDGVKTVRSTIRSGLAKGRLEPRSPPEPRPNGRQAAARPASRPGDAPSRPNPVGDGVPIPDWTPPDAKTGKPRFADIGAAAPAALTGEQRRHEYRRDGQAVRIKVKLGKGNYVDMYRVRRPEDGAVGWQAKRPTGWVPVPYVGPAGADDPFSPLLAMERAIWPEGEKDVDSLQERGFLAFTFGGSSDVPDGIDHLVSGREVVVAGDNDDPGRRCVERKIAALAKTSARIRRLDLPDLPVGGDVSDWLERAYHEDPTELWDHCVDPGPAPVAPPKPGYRLRPRLSTSSISRWVGVEPEPTHFVVDRIVPRGAVTILAGDGGAGKTMIVQTMMTCSATGRDFLGLPVETGPFAAAGIFGEDPDKILHARQIRICRSLSVNMADLVSTVRIESYLGTDLALWRNGQPTEFFREIEADLAAIPNLGLVAIDSASLVFAGNENDRGEVATFMSLLNGLANRLNVAIILLVHTSKTSSDTAASMASGSTAWVWQSRSALSLSVSKEGVTSLHHRKANHTKKIEPLMLRWSEDGVLELDPAAALLDRTDNGKAPRLGRQAKLGLKALRAALEDHGEPAPAMMRLPAGIRVVRFDFWRAELVKMLAEPGDDPKDATIRKSVQRVREELLGKSLIGYDEPHVWVVREAA